MVTIINNHHSYTSDKIHVGQLVNALKNPVKIILCSIDTFEMHFLNFQLMITIIPLIVLQSVKFLDLL